mmetsp:Transcript_28403/g.58124  ORF Transcript_28403/g.58124 Transcript_28403/m.58124 type:complete len:116 (+) Transcript_28403:1523-1870(+)
MWRRKQGALKPTLRRPSGGARSAQWARVEVRAVEATRFTSAKKKTTVTTNPVVVKVVGRLHLRRRRVVAVVVAAAAVVVAAAAVAVVVELGGVAGRVLEISRLLWVEPHAQANAL